MSELAQVFTILAFLAIGLIAITVPTYAISVSYLAREKAKISDIIKKKQEELKDKLEEFKPKLTESSATKELKNEIKKYEARIKELKTDLSYLSVKGAVGWPAFFFLVALTFSILGIYLHTAPDVGAYLFFTIVAVFLGLLSLGRTLRGVERAALRLPSPKLEVEFESGGTVEKFKAGEQKEMLLVLTNTGEDLAENARADIIFPPDFDVRKGNYNIFKQTGKATYPNYNAVLHHFPPPLCIYVGDRVTFKVSLKMPERTEKYVIPIEINARNMRKSEHQLTIEIVSKSGP